MQRIHQDDLIGHVLERGDWEHLCIPAIATERSTYLLSFGRTHTREVGAVLQPEREDFTQLMQTKRSMGTYNFSAQYQQDPIPPEGNIFKREWFQYYDVLPEKFDRILQSWDTGMQIGEKNDFSVGTTWGVLGDDLYLIDVIRERMEYPDLKRRIVEAADRYRPLVVVIEAAGAGLPVLQDLRGKTKHRFRPSNPRKDKEVRAYAASATAEDKHVVLPRSAPWLDDFISELIAFPGGRHDDQVDSFSQIVRWHLLHQKFFNRERPDPKRPTGLPLKARPLGTRRPR
jgi:predicted phage terminase large subunit-like protein